MIKRIFLKRLLLYNKILNEEISDGISENSKLNLPNEEYKFNGEGDAIRFLKWNYINHHIEIFDPNWFHLGSMDSQSGKIYRPAIQGRKLLIYKKVDILDDLYKKKINNEEANNLYTKIIQKYEIFNAWQMLGFSEFEQISLFYQVPLNVLVNWRYKKLPDYCYVCKKLLNFDEDLDNIVPMKVEKDFYNFHWRCLPEKTLKKYLLVLKQVDYNETSSQINLLEDLYKAKINIKQAYNFFYNIVSEFHNGHITNEKFLDIYKYCGFIESEAAADALGVPFNVIAKWRYEGWPNKCFICKKNIEIEKFYWLPERMGENIFQLKHTNCEN